MAIHDLPDGSRIPEGKVAVREPAAWPWPARILVLDTPLDFMAAIDRYGWTGAEIGLLEWRTI